MILVKIKLSEKFKTIISSDNNDDNIKSKQFRLILAPWSMNLEKLSCYPGDLSITFVNYIHSFLWEHSGLDNLKYLKAKSCNVLFSAA